MYTSSSESCFTIRLIHRDCIFDIDIHVDLCDIWQLNLLHCFVESFLCFFCCIFFLLCCLLVQFLKLGFEFFLFSENLNSFESFFSTKSCVTSHVFIVFNVDFSFFILIFTVLSRCSHTVFCSWVHSIFSRIRLLIQFFCFRDFLKRIHCLFC